VLTGCARYHPRPLDPPRLEEQYRSRSLSDAGLRAFVEVNSAFKPDSWPPSRWDLPALTLAAYYFNPQLAVARARYETARAAILTAKGRPNPSLSVGGGWTNSPESPLVFHFDPAITLETGRKRAYRILGAERQAEVAGLDVAETAWKVRGAVRAALLNHALAIREMELLAAEAQVRSASVDILERRFTVGEVSRPDVDLARAERNATEVALRAAQGRVAETRVALAAAIGLPASALDGVRIAWKDLDSLPAPASVSQASVRRAGLLSRPDVRRSLAEYAVAEAALQLEVARQYPDIPLSPGYGFDEGHHKFTIGPSLVIPLLNRNRGPIAEADARRAQAAARFLAVQAQAIGEIDRARQQYVSALAELQTADTQLRFFRQTREPVVLRAVSAGESDTLALIRARLEGALAARARLESLRRAQLALGALEEAIAAGLPEHLPAAPPAVPGQLKETR